jgi:hypothetical protein
MIEDKDLGLKFAESKEEAMWEKVRQARQATIESYEEALIVEREILKLAEQKLKSMKGGENGN